MNSSPRSSSSLSARKGSKADSDGRMKGSASASSSSPQLPSWPNGPPAPSPERTPASSPTVIAEKIEKRSRLRTLRLAGEMLFVLLAVAHGLTHFNLRPYLQVESDNKYVAKALNTLSDAVQSVTDQMSDSKERFDVCCVGAGLSGSVIAERYANVKNRRVLVLEKRNHIGGNCYDYRDQETGILVNKYGAHLFHTNSERVWEYIQQFSNWTGYEHRVLAQVHVDPDDASSEEKHVPVPVNIDTVNALFGLFVETPEEMRFWLEKETAQADPSKDWTTHKPQNSEEMAISRVGRRLFDTIFRPYTIKQWEKEPRQLGPEVTARIPVRDNFDDRYFGDKYQALPSQGYTKLFESMLNNPKITYRPNTDYFEVRDNIKCGRTYFTGPIDAYFSYLGWEKLEYRSLNFERGVAHNTEFFQPSSVVNHPPSSHEYTRIVEYKHFLNQSSPHTVYFKEHSKSGGEPYYPVPDQRNQDLFARYKQMAMQSSNVTFVGRLANYKYFNMDQSILNALELFDKDSGFRYRPQRTPPQIPQHDYSQPVGGPRSAPATRRRVLIYADHLMTNQVSETFVQLAVAFQSAIPEQRVFWLSNKESSTRNLIPDLYTGEYPSSAMLKVLSYQNITPGDIVILPSTVPCPSEEMPNGVLLFFYLLYPKRQIQIGRHFAEKERQCQLLAHSFWISEHPYTKAMAGLGGVVASAMKADKPLPLEHVIRSYTNPSHRPATDASINVAAKENIILLEEHNPMTVVKNIRKLCAVSNCTAISLKGMRKTDVADLYPRAKVVLNWCLSGVEPTSIEASLHGAILVTSPCQSSSDFRDFPLPEKHVIKSENDELKAVLGQILQNYEVELNNTLRFRQHFMKLTDVTMAWEAKNFYYAVDAKHQNGDTSSQQIEEDHSAAQGGVGSKITEEKKGDNGKAKVKKIIKKPFKPFRKMGKKSVFQVGNRVFQEREADE